MDKIALVTGSGRGIGAATAKYLANKDYAVCINYNKNAEAADKTLREIKAAGVPAISIKTDLSDENQVISLFKEIDKQLGTITALVNNAGILMPQITIEDIYADRLNQLFATNVTSCFICCREAVRRMSRDNGGNGGAIVNVSSVAARLGAPNEYIDYAASKGAIDTLTTGLSAEVAAQGIRVNCVRPGFIDTDMHADGGEPDRIERVRSRIPMNRGGEPAEVAAAIAWLLSDEASYVTGTFIDVAGGR